MLGGTRNIGGRFVTNMIVYPLCCTPETNIELNIKYDRKKLKIIERNTSLGPSGLMDDDPSLKIL